MYIYIWFIFITFFYFLISPPLIIFSFFVLFITIFIASLSTPGTTEYKSQLPLEADQTIPMELFPAPPATPAKGKANEKDRKSRVSTTSKSSKSGEKVDASKSSVIPPAVNPYEGSILTMEMNFSEPLYLPLPPPLESILKPQDVVPNREPLKPIEKTKEATYIYIKFIIFYHFLSFSIIFYYTYT